MTLEYRKLADSEIQSELSHVPNWRVDEGHLVRLFEFHSYLEGPLFALKVAHIAEDLNHHPDIIIGYRKVWVRVNTHDVGGISPFDFELASRIDVVA